MHAKLREIFVMFLDIKRNNKLYKKIQIFYKMRKDEIQMQMHRNKRLQATNHTQNISQIFKEILYLHIYDFYLKKKKFVFMYLNIPYHAGF